jgi:hypothetical protein
MRIEMRVRDGRCQDRGKGERDVAYDILPRRLFVVGQETLRRFAKELDKKPTDESPIAAPVSRRSSMGAFSRPGFGLK